MKRLICVMLALMMLMSLIPVSASAADMAISENGINVLKQLQNYRRDCIQCGEEYRIGYGTICPYKSGHGSVHAGYDESDADRDLRAKLKELNAAVNTFAYNAGVTLTQNQFDALVCFSYDAGTAWLNGTGVLRNAVVNGLTGNAFLNAIGQSSAMGADATDKVTGMTRRMIEGNMYINGSYSNIAPSNYGGVKYDPNGGVMAEAGADGTYTQYFDGYAAAPPAPVPTRAGYIFLGWYQDTTNKQNGTWVPRLNFLEAKNGKLNNLVAQWQRSGSTWKDTLADAGAKRYNWLSLKGIASNQIFANPDSTTVIGYHTDDAVMVDYDFIDAKGARWGHLMNGSGWVLVSGATSGTNNGGFEIDVNVTVTNSTLNRRKNATIFSKTNGAYTYGDKLRIVSTANADGFLWGQVADKDDVCIGWVALRYTNWDEVKNDPNASNKTDTSDPIGVAVVNCSGYLNVRSDAGTDNAIVGALADGDHVNIFDIKFVNGHKWGRVSNGWILLTYAKVTMTDESANFGTSDDVLAYTFTGVLKNAATAHTDVDHNSELVGKEIPAGTLVAVSMVKNDTAGNIWGYNGTGWLKLDNVIMDVAKYVVVADAVTVRSSYNSSASSVDKVVKGVELDISEIKVVDATIWGKTEKYGGWVNLASKFVKRSNAPIVENTNGGNGEYNWIATVINTDNVNVRTTGATYGKKIGSLSRGTTVRVWDGSEEKGWYKLDTNQNGVFDENGDGWVSAKYLSLDWSPMGAEDEEDGNDTAGNGGTAAGVETGLGVVANTYSGVNIRTGAGTGYAATGKYLNGTAIEILEVVTTATSKWGRTVQGWVCMDYVTMVNKYPIGGSSSSNEETKGPNAGGSATETTGNTTISTTPVSYTGTIAAGAGTVNVLKTADPDALVVNTMTPGQNVTIQELRKVLTKETVTNGTVVDGNATTESTTTTTNTYIWARVNGGWIMDPAATLSLNPLDEVIYTATSSDEVDVRGSDLSSHVTEIQKGTQVTITSLQIAEDKVWGFAEDVGTSGGWIRLDKMSEGAITIQTQTPSENNNNNGATNNGGGFQMGVGSDNSGFVNNTAGYRYTGKVINTNEVNVRATPSTAATITTTLKNGGALVIYETTIAENMAWGRCDAGWVYLYYVDLTPVTGAVDARVVYNDNAIIYTDMNMSGTAGTYARMSVIDIFEIVGTMARTNQGWVKTTDLL